MRDPARPEPTVALEVLRDLVAIARALYRVETDPVRLQELVEVGKAFEKLFDSSSSAPARLAGGRPRPTRPR
jgi:hypothetical protein